MNRYLFFWLCDSQYGGYEQMKKGNEKRKYILSVSIVVCLMLGILFVGVKWINKDAATIEEQQLKYSGVTTGIQSIQPEDNKDEESSETVQETQELKKDENGKYILNNGDIFAYTGYMDELAKGKV